MGCSTCAIGGGKPQGCKSNGSCSCNRLNSFDWLSDMDMPDAQAFDIVEVRFKAGRKEYFRNIDSLSLYTGDKVVVQVQKGYHVGEVTLQGELVRLRMRKKKIKNDDQIMHVLRIANANDLEKLAEAQNREMTTLYRTREIISELELEMKLSDIEYQTDQTKATFYYSADNRVDFRELIRILASEFRTRVEMRQISLRQEAGRIGGIGSCGRELCCSTWLTSFKSVSTSAARYQNLSLNPHKLSGQCGRLKCCLNYELETYVDALNDIPEVTEPLMTEAGPATLQKTDIFKRVLWFSYDTENNWIPIPADQVTVFIEQNKAGKKIPALSRQQDLAIETKPTQEKPAIDTKEFNIKYEEKYNQKGAEKPRKRRRRNRKPRNNG